MKICLAQTKIWFEEKEKNLRIAEQLTGRAVKNGAELILFPEMSFTGFSMNTDRIGENEKETVERMSELAKKRECSIGFGWVEKNEQGCMNHYTVTGRDGNVLADYVKIHPFSFSDEDKFYTAGDHISLFESGGVRMTAFICYDLRFPELFRRVADDVSCILVPANWPAKRSLHWKTLLRARAIENQVYIIGINCQGDMDGQYYAGDSCIFSPNGDLLETLSDRDGLILYDLRDDTERYRTAFPVLKDRKNELYTAMYQEMIRKDRTEKR